MAILFSDSPARIRRALWIPLGCGVLAWLLWQLASYLDSQGEPQLESGPRDVRFVALVQLVALTTVATGALLARVNAIRELRDEHAARSRLSIATFRFTTVCLAVAAVLVTVAALTVFLNGFVWSGAGSTPLGRIIEVYVPIVVYTGLAVSLLIATFTVRAPKGALVLISPAASDTPKDASPSSRTLALAFAIPVVATALGMMSGLIAFDLTDHAPDVSVWLLIFTWIGAGIVTGTVLATRAATGLTRSSDGFGATVAARRLNFVLSLLFLTTTVVMSIGYGLTAINRLQIQATLFASVYSDGSSTPTIDVTANGVQQYSPVHVTLSPADAAVIDGQADVSGFFSRNQKLSERLAPGTYVLEATAIAPDNSTLTLRSEFAIDANGAPVETKSSQPALANGRMSPSLGWFTLEFAPALGLFVLAELVTLATLLARNRSRTTA